MGRAKTFTEEEYQRELERAIVEGRLPQFPGHDADEEKERRLRGGKIRTNEIRYN